MEGEIEIDIKIESIKFVQKNYRIRNGTNISQVRKMITKMTQLPFSEIVINEVKRPNEDESYFDDQAEHKKKNTYVLQNKDILSVEIATFYKDLVDMDFCEGSAPVHFKFQVYKTDLLKNLRTKIWFEMKSKSSEYAQPNEIEMSIGGMQNVLVNDDHNFLTVQQFIQQNDIQKINKKYHLSFLKQEKDFISLQVNHDFEGVKIRELRFIENQYDDQKEKIKQIISAFELQFKSYKQYEQLKNTHFSNSSQNEMFDRERSLLQQLYEKDRLHITVENMQTNSPDLRQYLRNNTLKSGMVIGFQLIGIS